MPKLMFPHFYNRVVRLTMIGPMRGWALGLALALAAWGATVGRGEVIRVGVDMTSKPLSFIDSNGKPTGYTKDLFDHLAKKTGLQFELVPNYWAHQMTSLQEGTILAVANTLVTDERRATMDFSLPHAYLHGIAFVRPNSEKVERIAQLAGKKIAVLSGSVAETEARRRNFWGGQLVVCNGHAAVFLSVARGEADVGIGQVLTSIAANQQGLKYTFIEDMRYDFTISVRKGNGYLLERLNNGLLGLHLDGTIDELYRKWLGPVEPRPLRWVDLRRFAMPAGFIFFGAALLITRQFYTQKMLKQRLHFARDLHNELGNRLSELQLITERTALEQPALSTPLQNLRQRVVEAAQSLNELVWVLRPESDPWSQAGANLEKIARAYLDAAGVRSEINVDVDWDMENRPAKPLVRRAVLMATRELLRNAVQHAKPAWVKVDLAVTAAAVTLVITDSGPGINLADAMEERRGMFHLNQRIRDVGGWFRGERTELGFSVFVTIPLHR